MLILDRITRPPGLLRRALMYSLVVEEGRLCALCTGKSSNPVMWGSVRHAALVKTFDSTYEPEVEAAEAGILRAEIAPLLANKDSFEFSARDISRLIIQERLWTSSRIVLEAAGQRLVFSLSQAQMEEATAFVSRARQMLGLPVPGPRG
jgi:hypothetical protein